MELRITFEAERDGTSKIMRAVPSAVLKGGKCEVLIEGAIPFEVADRTKELLDQVRGAVGSPKAGKRL